MSSNAVAGLLAIAMFAASVSGSAFDLQGHRGARGLAPENSLAGFALALSIGVSTLELDLAMTHDRELVVMHNPRFEPYIARDARGEWLQQASPTVRSMTLEQVKTYDVGRLNPAQRYARRYPEQRSIDGARVPTLGEVFDLVKSSPNPDVRFNIEIKINPEEPLTTFGPTEFATALVAMIRRRGLEQQVTIQSFDWRVLRHVQVMAPELVTAYLSANQSWLNNLQIGRQGVSPWLAGFDVDEFGGSVARTVEAAGGDIWSPYHREVDDVAIREAQDSGVAVVVWTVNEPARMHELIEMGVDGIITDYPDRLRRVLEKLGRPTPTSFPAADWNRTGDP